MSVLNVHLAADRIVLVSDSLLYAHGEPAGLTASKVRIARRFAWSTRGLCRLGDSLDPLAAGCDALDGAAFAARRWIEALNDGDLAGSKGIEARTRAG